MTSGYTALKGRAARLDQSARGKLAVRGPDRARIVHALATNDVSGLDTGQGCYAFFLNEQGRIVADANIFNIGSELLIDTEAETRQTLFDHIDRYIIADDATVVDITASLPALGVEGPESAGVLRHLGASLPADRDIIPWPHGFVARTSYTGQPGFGLFVWEESWDAVMAAVEAAGANPATVEDARTVRIENGKPRYGEEIGPRYLALETGQNHAIHPQKGCYLGQEVVERVRSRGLLGRVLRPLRVNTKDPPPPGTKLLAGNLPAGTIVSSVYSPGLGVSACLAYLRVNALLPGTTLTLADEGKGSSPDISVVIGQDRPH